MKQERIDRINTLYHKSQAVGLTEEEKKEQAALRKEYIESIRGNMRGQLNSILIKEKDGSITDLGKKYGYSFIWIADIKTGDSRICPSKTPDSAARRKTTMG